MYNVCKLGIDPLRKVSNVRTVVAAEDLRSTPVLWREIGLQVTVARGRPASTIERLWKQYLENREHLEDNVGGEAAPSEASRRARRLRDKLVVNYSPLVKYVANMLPSRLRAAAESEDVLAWGLIGLLNAVESYDPSRNTKFESYAIYRIKWTILDELRRQDWLPRRVRMRAQEIDRAATELSQTLSRVPTEEEVADAVGMTAAEYRKFVEQYSRAQTSSLEARMEMNERVGTEFHSLVIDRGARNPQSEADQASLREEITEAISELKEQERLVATFYFYEGLTLKEIGRVLDLTEGRISQVLHRALIKLRENLTGSPILTRL